MVLGMDFGKFDVDKKSGFGFELGLLRGLDKGAFGFVKLDGFGIAKRAAYEYI